MTTDIKKEIIHLLREDLDPRYTVAGLIGLEEVLRRLDRHQQRNEQAKAVGGTVYKYRILHALNKSRSYGIDQ